VLRIGALRDWTRLDGAPCRSTIATAGWRIDDPHLSIGRATDATGARVVSPRGATGGQQNEVEVTARGVHLEGRAAAIHQQLAARLYSVRIEEASCLGQVVGGLGTHAVVVGLGVDGAARPIGVLWRERHNGELGGEPLSEPNRLRNRGNSAPAALLQHKDS
jgi:hypothetical protein